MRIILRSCSFMLGLLLSVTAHADDFVLTTNAFLDTGALPVMYTCDGKDVSPQLSWSNPPEKTQSYAIIVSDPEAPGGTFYHWVVYNIPASTKEFVEGVQKLPAGTLVGENGWTKLQYDGPCPPKGTAHTYHYTLYALSAPIKLPAGADGKSVVTAMKENILKQVELTTVYSRWLK